MLLRAGNLHKKCRKIIAVFVQYFFKKSIDRLIFIAYNTITKKQENKTKKEIKK
jgi:hypothetical protein